MKITKVLERLAIALEQNTAATYESMALNEQLSRARLQVDKANIAIQEGLLKVLKTAHNIKDE